MTRCSRSVGATIRSRTRNNSTLPIRSINPNCALEAEQRQAWELDRHDTWAVIVCLVGGGQEVHTGEAGIGAWLEAVRRAFPKWRTYVSPDLSGTECAAAATIDALDGAVPLERDARLHLNTSMRSRGTPICGSSVDAGDTIPSAVTCGPTSSRTTGSATS